MSIGSLSDKAAAILRRDTLTAIRYRAGFLLTAAAGLAELIAFYYLAGAIGPNFRPDGLGYFPFLLVGAGFYTFMVMGVNAFLRTVQEAQQTGTLEVLMNSSTPPSTLIILSAVSAFAGNAGSLLFYLGAGLLLFGQPVHPNLPACLIIFALSLMVAVAIGVMAAAIQLAIQKGSAVIWILGSGVWCLSGAMFPVASLPRALQHLSSFIPITYSLDAMRHALLQGATFSNLAHEILILGLFALLLLPGSLALFSYTLRRARIEGTLSYY